MRQIRNGVFETNSSSSHSIALRKCGHKLTPEEIQKEFEFLQWSDNKLNLWNESSLEFGRSPFTPLTGLYDKFKYAVASYSHDAAKRRELENILYEAVPNLVDIKYPTILDWETDKETTFYGDVDHQSCGVLQSFLEKHHVSLKDFLLDTKYVVFIDGDEYQIVESLFDSGLLHESDFTDVVGGCGIEDRFKRKG